MMLIRYVGLDVHKDSIKIAVAEEGENQPDSLHQYLAITISLSAESEN